MEDLKQPSTILEKVESPKFKDQENIFKKSYFHDHASCPICCQGFEADTCCPFCDD